MSRGRRNAVSTSSHWAEHPGGIEGGLPLTHARSDAVNDLCRIRLEDAELPMGFQDVIQGRRASMWTQGQVQAPLVRNLGMRHDIVERAQAPALALRVPNEGVIAQVIVIVGYEDVNTARE